MKEARAARWRSASSGTPSGCAARRARARSPRSARGRTGGSLTTRCTARSRERSGGRSWTEWDEPLRRREPQALDAARARARRPRSSSTSTCSGSPTSSGRTRARPRRRCALFGDFPFMVDADSADVWARQHLFRLDATVGAPPDAFSATGQDWGMPVYRWDVMDARGLPLAARARAAQRAICSTATASITSSASTARTRARSTARRRQLRRRPTSRRSSRSASGCIGVFRGARRARSSPRISASCPTSSASRWRARRPRLQRVPLGARLAHAGPAVPRSRRATRALSVATTGTHDTEPIATWWDTAGADEREAFAALPQIAPVLDGRPEADRRSRRRSVTRSCGRSTRPGPTCCSPDPGRLRLARSHQHAGDRHRRQLDLAPALAGRHARRSTRRRKSVRRCYAIGR